MTRWTVFCSMFWFELWSRVDGRTLRNFLKDFYMIESGDGNSGLPQQIHNLAQLFPIHVKYIPSPDGRQLPSPQISSYCLIMMAGCSCLNITLESLDSTGTKAVFWLGLCISKPGV